LNRLELTPPDANRDASAGSLEVLKWLAARIQARWRQDRIVLRGDSGFCRGPIMQWCEEQRLFYLLGLAKNNRLINAIANKTYQVSIRHHLTGTATRTFSQIFYQTRNSSNCKRRVIAKAEHLSNGANPRFVVTNLPEDYASPRGLYEKHYCARGDMVNRTKEQQLDLFADRTSCQTMRANQLRLWFSSLAYVLMSALRRIALVNTSLAKATCGTIRLKLLKIGARVKVSVRRIAVHLPTAYPYEQIFADALKQLNANPLRT